jgi:hypothetical protein
VPFAAQQQAIHANGGRAIARSELKSLGIYASAAQVRMTPPASGAESRSGMNRAARPEPAAPVVPPQSIGHPAAAPQREAQPPARDDRPPTAFGQSRIEERARANDVPRPAEARSPVAQDLNRRVDRPAAPPPRAPLPTAAAPPPAPAPPPVQVARPPTPEPKPKPKPAAHDEQPTHPAMRNNN